MRLRILELDADLLVRKATIHCDVNGTRTRIEVTTQGTIEKDGLLLAASGRFQRYREPSAAQRERGIMASSKHAENNGCSMQFVSIILNLSDQQYGEMSRFEIEPLMQVDDYVRDIHGTGVRQDDGTVIVRRR